MLQTGLRANTVEEEVEDGAVVTREMTVSGSGVTVTGGGAGADYHEVKHRSHDRVRIEIKKAKRDERQERRARERRGNTNSRGFCRFVFGLRRLGGGRGLRASDGAGYLAVHLDVHEQVVVLVAALFGREARAVLLAVADIGRLPGSVVGAPAVGVF